VTGRPARFELFASDNARGHRAGDVVALDGVDLDPLPPVHASFGDASVAGEEVRVALQGELSAIGTLDLACVELSPASPPARRFELAFDLRGAPDRAIRASQAAPAPRGGGIDARASRPFAEAVVAVERVFGKAARDVTPREVKDLVRELERVLGERGGWDAATTRALFDAILPLHKGRRRSADHERVFWQLAGYCLRPGTGDAGDPPRVRGLAQLLPDRLAFADEVRGWQQFWFAWRRVAGGLDASTQLALRDLVDPVLAPREAGKKAPKGWRTAALESVDAVLETASSLERVPASRRAELGAWILERTWTDRDPRLWAALGRLGARIPVYASTSHVVSPGTVERWVDHLLREKWAEVPTAVEAAVRMARVSGDRARDLPERVRREVARRLAQAGLGDEAVRPVIELVTLGDEATEQAALLGEGLPVGLRLLPAGTTDLTDTPD
jgi:hypothetical protein